LTGKPGMDGKPAGYTQGQCGLELYDLEADIGEKHNVIEEHPDIVERLTVMAEKMRDDLGDALTGREGMYRRPRGELPQKEKPAKTEGS
jgi:hypothetical protein